MKKKIYNKKVFWSGILFSTISLGYLILLVTRFSKINSGDIIKYIIYGSLAMIFGFSAIRQSLNYDATKKAKQENDEREKFIDLKASDKAINLIQVACFILMFLSAFIWHKTRIDGYIGMIVAFGLMFKLSLILPIFTYFYYDKRY
ncbi:hypothetical protein [Jeotgalibaca dankookensis]|uniref:hypothetical protein n=1 Tax=Jeotgalibaca dankookensis TaxID=708126 RepID=UPI0007846A60|nr:hypothetical protein [Jeotgalibaca dankookensis]